MHAALKRGSALAAALAVTAALTITALGDPSPEMRVEQARPALAAQIAARAPHVDPWELYTARWNNRVKLILVDVRDEADFNLFHIRGAKRIPVSELTARWPVSKMAVVVMSNDEARADEAWIRLQALGQTNSYVLAGGVNLWLDIFHGAHPHVHAASTSTEDVLRHHLDEARGGDWPAAFPPRPHEGAPERPFTKRIKIKGAAAKSGGGCG